MFIEILKTFIESGVEFKILHYLYPLALTPSPMRLTSRFGDTSFQSFQPRRLVG